MTPRTRILELAQARGWSRERLSRESGVNSMSLRWAIAGRPVSAENLIKIARALDVPLREIDAELAAAFASVAS